MQKYSPEYLEAKRLKEKKRQHDYYLRVTKPQRGAKLTLKTMFNFLKRKPEMTLEERRKRSLLYPQKDFTTI